jgi:hypothetical protein
VYANPACFLLRHAIELALKIALPGSGHHLRGRLDAISREHGDPPPELVELNRPGFVRG